MIYISSLYYSRGVNRPFHVEDPPAKRRFQRGEGVSGRGRALCAAMSRRETSGGGAGVCVVLRAEGEKAYYWKGKI